MSDENAPKRSKGRSRVTWLLLALLVAWFLYRLTASPLLPDGSAAPSWKLPLADGTGDYLGSEELVGKVVVVDFWSTTCPPCLREMDELKSLFKQWNASQVAIVGIATGGESVGEIERFREERGVEYPLVVDNGAVSAAYRVATLPTLYIIDAGGKIVDSHRGYWGRDGIVSAVQSALSR